MVSITMASITMSRSVAARGHDRGPVPVMRRGRRECRLQGGRLQGLDGAIENVPGFMATLRGYGLGAASPVAADCRENVFQPLVAVA